MDTKAVIALMRDLVHLDVDAIHAYDQALKNIDVAHIRSQLERAKADHERHISELSAAIVDLGGTAPVIRRDMKGLLIEGMTALRSAMGTEQSLRAMQTNEKLTNKTYQEALDDRALPDDVREVVLKNRADEARHLDWINKALDQRLWESAGQTTLGP